MTSNLANNSFPIIELGSTGWEITNIEAHYTGAAFTGTATLIGPNTHVGLTMLFDSNGNLTDLVAHGTNTLTISGVTVTGSNLDYKVSQKAFSLSQGTIAIPELAGLVGTFNNLDVNSQGVVYGGSGNDTIVVSDTHFRRIDGGTGVNTLQLAGYANENWDITQLSPGYRIKNIEIINTLGYGANILTLNSLSVISISPTHIVSVDLDSSDTLNLSPDFNYAGIIYYNGQNYSQYQSSNAKVLVNVPYPNNQVEFKAPANNTWTAINDPAGGAIAASSLIASPSDSVLASDPNISNTEIGTQPEEISISDPTTSEDSPIVQFTVTRIGDSSNYLSVYYKSQDISNQAGDNQYPFVGSLVFAPGETIKTIIMAKPIDQGPLSAEQFQVQAAIEQSSSTPLSPWQLKVTQTNGAQLRDWQHQVAPTDSIPVNALSQLGEFNFYVTADSQGQASITLNATDGQQPITTIYIQNESGQWEPFNFDGTTGAIFSNQHKLQQVTLKLTDGLRGDQDGVSNGVIHVVAMLGTGLNINYINDLGTLGGQTSQALGLNNLGQVVGSSTTASGGTHPFLFNDANNNLTVEPGEVKDLASLGSVNNSCYATSVNASGEVVGYYDSTSGSPSRHAFIQAGTNPLSDLGTLGGTVSVATAIKNNIVVGYSTTSNGQTHSFEFVDTNGNGTKDNNETLVDLSTTIHPITGSYSRATAVNSNADIVGSSNA
jgi:probable HAF family extracellular repeat protein